MLADLDALTDLGSELTRRARARGALLVWRAQSRRAWGVSARSGRVENAVTTSSSGHGMQAFLEDGRTALASRDDFAAEPALGLLDRVLAAAALGPRLGTVPVAVPALEPARARLVPGEAAGYRSPDPEALGRRLLEIEAELAARVPGVTLEVAAKSELDAWRIFRSDGTDVTFAMPRTVIRVTASTGGDGERHTVGASASGPRADLAWDDAAVARLLRRGEAAARLARDLPSAPAHPAGSIPVVVDYALAKGLAHEAFGHASEADGFRSSVLAKGGRFRAGERVGASHVSVVDEPVAGDHAWQPYSANGLPRERATIVDHGVLRDALTDPWSAAAAGVRITGAERAESFRSAPVPRMTNIRIEVDAPLPAPGAFEDHGPDEVRALLREAGVLRRHPRVAYLSGYAGGQVNPATGDFVFNCRSIWVLDDRGASLHRPAIFSGSMFGALGAVREAFGPLALDAIGTCGKAGQSVPSSGGSHWFLVLDPDPTVRLGGR